MRAVIQPSTQFLQVQDRHQVLVLIADRGDFDGAAGPLREAARKLEAYRGVSTRSAELADDLVGEAERFAGRQEVTEDRNCHMARGAAEMANRGRYVGKVGRHRKPEPR